MKPNFKFNITIKFVLLITSMITFSTPCEAQFLKKLKKKVTNAVENEVIRKTSDKAASETGEKMEDIFNTKIGKSDVDLSKLPSNYDFEWRYALEMSTKGKSFQFNYFLKPEAKYYGAIPDVPGTPTASDMFMVMDAELGAHIIFMDLEGSKMAQVMDINLEDIMEDDSNDVSDYTFTELGTKTILGYTCQGFKMENDEVEMIMYVTNDAPVSFTQVFGQDANTLPKGFDPKWLDKMENGCMMEMDFKNKKKDKHSAKMRCVAIEKDVRSMKLSDYQIMGSGMPKTNK